MNTEAKQYFDQIVKEQHEQLMREIETLENKKWRAVRKKMFKWLEDNGRMPKQ